MEANVKTKDVQTALEETPSPDILTMYYTYLEHYYSSLSTITVHLESRGFQNCGFFIISKL